MHVCSIYGIYMHAIKLLQVKLQREESSRIKG